MTCPECGAALHPDGGCWICPCCGYSKCEVTTMAPKKHMISPHFSYAELTRSAAAVEHGLSNDPPPYLLDNLRRTAEALEEIRAHFNKPVLVTSCYRSPEVNTAIGGSVTSAHRFGLAADFTVQDVPNLEVIKFIYYHLPGFDQVIEEFGQWIHLGLALKSPRGQALTAVKVAGRTQYKPGISGVMA